MFCLNINNSTVQFPIKYTKQLLLEVKQLNSTFFKSGIENHTANIKKKNDINLRMHIRVVLFLKSSNC